MPTPGNYGNTTRGLVNSKTSTTSSKPFRSKYAGPRGYKTTMPKGKGRRHTYGQKHDPVRRNG